jgi:hypothetical protein
MGGGSRRWPTTAVVALATVALTLVHVFSTVHRLHEPTSTASSPQTRTEAPLRLTPPWSPPPSPSSPASAPPPPLPRFPAPSRASRGERLVSANSGGHGHGSNGHGSNGPCASPHLVRLLALQCNPAKAAATAAAETADAAALQSALVALQHPHDCAAHRIVTYKDWRNGLGAQLSSLVGAWTAQLSRTAPFASTAAEESPPPLLVPIGGLRYANKARCPRRDLSCYFEPFTSCEATAGAKSVRAAKTPPDLAERVSRALRLERPHDKWWLRKELTRYIFRPNNATRTMLERVRDEMGLAGSPAGAAGDASPRTSQLVAIHVRRGDKRDLGAKERGEPFSDAMYVKAAKALADELDASGFLLASSEPETLRRLPPLLGPRPTFIMPARYFVQVPEGLTPHQVVERTKQEAGGNDEGLSQIVQLLLLSECRGFLGTITSNFGLVVTKLMAFRQPKPVAIDLSCAGLTPMQPADENAAGRVWSFEWDGKDAVRCRGFGSREEVPKKGDEHRRRADSN